MPIGLEPRRIVVGVDRGDLVEAFMGVPHEAQNLASVSNFAPHFAQYGKDFTLVQNNWMNGKVNSESI